MQQKVDETAKGMEVYEVTALAYGFEFLSLTVGEATWSILYVERNEVTSGRWRDRNEESPEKKGSLN